MASKRVGDVEIFSTIRGDRTSAEGTVAWMVDDLPEVGTHSTHVSLPLTDRETVAEVLDAIEQQVTSVLADNGKHEVVLAERPTQRVRDAGR